jgi:CheY-like chemotaxis protein
MKNPYILMVENDEDDRYITREYFNDASIPVKMLDGTDELFSELASCVQRNQPLPALILMNFYTGPMDTRDTLIKLKQSTAYSHIPVVILSESTDDTRIRYAYNWGASSFIKKPALVDETNKKISNFITYWFGTVELA